MNAHESCLETKKQNKEKSEFRRHERLSIRLDMAAFFFFIPEIDHLFDFFSFA